MRAQLLGVVVVAACSCGRSELYAPGELIAEGRPMDAGMTTDAGCGFDQTIVGDVFGQTVFAGGSAPAGSYRISIIDGCMKYSSVGQGWSVNAYGSGPDNFWLIDGANAHLLVAPGTVGFIVGQGGFTSFDDCVSANRALPPKDFDFAGGKLGIWLADSPYTDNVAGESNRNPTWRISSKNCR